MPILPRALPLVRLIACSDGSDADTGGGDARSDPPLPKDPNFESFCACLADVFEDCAGPTTDTGFVAECVEVYAPCTGADFDVLYGMADCIAADCADQTCFEAFENLSSECL